MGAVDSRVDVLSNSHPIHIHRPTAAEALLLPFSQLVDGSRLSDIDLLQTRTAVQLNGLIDLRAERAAQELIMNKAFGSLNTSVKSLCRDKSELVAFKHAHADLVALVHRLRWRRGVASGKHLRGVPPATGVAGWFGFCDSESDGWDMVQRGEDDINRPEDKFISESDAEAARHQKAVERAAIACARSYVRRCLGYCKIGLSRLRHQLAGASDLKMRGCCLCSVGRPCTKSGTMPKKNNPNNRACHHRHSRGLHAQAIGAVVSMSLRKCRTVCSSYCIVAVAGWMLRA